ncbi:hypothetical protein BVG16_20900 [Paenibacillus selenitireducens]|uniref:HTH gntR-type domain-containing protein n=1 Tax=Paenibacillus selenitireducens TaxID=1324314 RepID=A0A1T2X7H0_9BACL|nr:PLP-dependent aminotransferase family protein [Paenibacillus selenitireducens]OPA75828.1 hypothetical protein BVG16_20900 [Paenibacillus selenitireducens]
MHWKPDITSDEPIYLQIARVMENQIMQGAWLPGSRLPTERELAALYGIHRSTVTAAYAELRARGYITSVQGRGTSVSDSLWGILPARTPNWNDYHNRQWFHPSNEMIDTIRRSRKRSNITNLSFSHMPEDLLPRVEMEQIMQRLSIDGSLNYADPRGHSHLRDVVVDHLSNQYGIHASRDQILITMGAEHALYLIAHRLLSPGDSIALESHSYIYTKSMFASAGLRMIPLPTDEEGLIPEELIPLIHKKKVRMLFINPTYQNPTGTTLSLARRKELLRICEEHRIPIVEDDPYGALPHDGAARPPQSIKALHGKGQSVIYVGTLTKSAAPAFRIGWIVAPEVIVKRLSEKKAEAGYSAHPLSELIAAHYMEHGAWQKQVHKLRSALTTRKQALTESLTQHLGNQLSYHMPQGGYYLWAQHRFPHSDRELLNAGIREGVLFVPGSVYGGPQGSIRFCFLNETEERIQEGIRALSNMLNHL